MRPVYLGVSLLGLATRLAAASNRSRMLDMTAANKAGLFTGAWGMADAFARLVGDWLSGGLRAAVTGRRLRRCWAV